MPDTLTAQPGSEDGLGGFVASGASIAVDCHIEGVARLVRDAASGREVVSSAQAYVGSSVPLTVEGYRYTLPAPYPVSADPNGHRAVTVGQERDEEGQLYQVVMLP